ncbi:hypothetical protein ElyMa_000942200 [Elysia marginata]|uniref:Uncharacterized protein n=1 Tax=Elysia marginata TaxID=1093978 RepID=A0AAV4HAM6_9GAST|nr:hypothetical protein ElyMa_000942200 [Elysia marginata]
MGEISAAFNMTMTQEDKKYLMDEALTVGKMSIFQAQMLLAQSRDVMDVLLQDAVSRSHIKDEVLLESIMKQFTELSSHISELTSSYRTLIQAIGIEADS